MKNQLQRQIADALTADDEFYSMQARAFGPTFKSENVEFMSMAAEIDPPEPFTCFCGTTQAYALWLGERRPLPEGWWRGNRLQRGHKLRNLPITDRNKNGQYY